MGCIVRLDKSFTFRGSPEIWSNKYHLTGGDPADVTEWSYIVNALAQAEKSVYTSATTIVYASGYTSDTGAAVYTQDFTVAPSSPIPGTYGAAATGKQAGDAAMWARWWCGRYNSRGKKIYLRKYFHDVWSVAAGGDQLAATQKTALENYASALVSGIPVTGYGTRALCDKDGNVAEDYAVVTYITTRTLKRRGGSPL